jgi:hypothetical protein
MDTEGTSKLASRRSVLGIAVAALALYACPFCAGTANAYHDGPIGCLLHYENAKQLVNEVRIVQSSGDQELDALCNLAGGHLTRLFGVSPAFAFFDDRPPGGGIRWRYKGNAFATTAKIGDSNDGSVLMGLTLAGFASARTHLNRRWKVAVVSILAHEWGHILQYKRQMAPAVYTTELQADFLAGWFLAKTGGSEEDAKQGMWQMFSVGDRLP